MPGTWQRLNKYLSLLLLSFISFKKWLLTEGQELWYTFRVHGEQKLDIKQRQSYREIDSSRNRDEIPW